MMNSVGGHVGYDGLTATDGGLMGHPNGIGTHPDDLAMMDDLERAKHYKSNIIQDFNDRQSLYSSRTAGFKSRYDGHDSGLYSDSKSMYGGYGASSGVDGKIYSDSKSVYGGGGGYGGGASAANNLRRSRSIHAKLPPRRDPYDYLPDEPAQTQLLASAAAAGSTADQATGANATANSGTMVGNKPDIMQSVGLDGPDPRR